MPETQTAAAARRRGRPPEAERARRRDDILDAAVQLFVQDGFEPVTLDRIAAAAHVAKRTIYRYIGDRTEVFLAAVERLRERALQLSPTDGLEQLALAIVLTLHSDDAIGLHRLAIGESHRFPDLAVRFYDDGPLSYIAALRSRLPESDADRAEALFALLLGEPHRQRLLGLRPAPDRAEAAAHASAALSALGMTGTTREGER
ncbi:TetR/AcrR family transcriptional regulator [uncultured Leifsonia sp.]|uniref:TetR/AcrR family transcriptional regulator n=1 Tax=uncultured Leifsonia sp. TaxID=340359 RepID=UPI0028D14F16|nr:TetR/AcrR family transcriptional regulator [uncultured Leifsonia sp.]